MCLNVSVSSSFHCIISLGTACGDSVFCCSGTASGHPFLPFHHHYINQLHHHHHFPHHHRERSCSSSSESVETIIVVSISSLMIMIITYRHQAILFGGGMHVAMPLQCLYSTLNLDEASQLESAGHLCWCPRHSI